MKNILFIEDEEALQKTLKGAFGKEDYKIISALDGKKGLELAKTERPDLILLDLILPKMNGFDVLKQIKEDPSIKDVPVIVLTNLEEVQDINRVLELGATTYLIKADYSLEELITKIKKALNGDTE